MSRRCSPTDQWSGVPISESVPRERFAPLERKNSMIAWLLLPQAIWMGERPLW